MTDWERHAATTESEIVFRIKGLLKIVFEDLSDIGIVELKRYLQQFISYQQTNYLLIFFVTIGGETTARSTKQLLSEFKVTLLGFYGYKVIFILANISLFLFAILLTQVS